MWWYFCVVHILVSSISFTNLVGHGPMTTLGGGWQLPTEAFATGGDNKGWQRGGNHQRSGFFVEKWRTYMPGFFVYFGKMWTWHRQHYWKIKIKYMFNPDCRTLMVYSVYSRVNHIMEWLFRNQTNGVGSVVPWKCKYLGMVICNDGYFIVLFHCTCEGYVHSHWVC